MTNPSKIILTLLSFIIIQKSWTQQAFDYEWAHHNIVFTLKADFKPVTNTADEFTADGDGMEFGIFPFSDASVDHSNITAYTIHIAKSLELEQLDDVDIIELNGLKGSYVEGYKEGTRIIVLGFIDPDSDTNFFATITFGDKDNVAEDEAVEILKSIRKKE
ncbi:MAG: hypothetical protein IT267_02720 [Saprospiraceae bacterium]|nr:hypothetical protein [Saprospiraceae bacterium]